MDRNSTEHLTPYPYQHKSPAPVKKPTSKWIKVGIPVFVIVIGAIVVGVVLSQRHTNKNSSGAAESSGVPGSASSAVSVKLAIGRFATATDSEFMVPLYPSTVSL